MPATSVLSAKFSEAATPVTAAPDPAPSQNTMSVVPFGIDTVAPVPCVMVAALLPVKEFLIIKFFKRMLKNYQTKKECEKSWKTFQIQVQLMQN